MLHKRINAAGIKEGNLCLRGKYITAVPGDSIAVTVRADEKLTPGLTPGGEK